MNEREERSIAFFGLLASIPVLFAMILYIREGGSYHNAIIPMLGAVVTMGIYSTLYRENPIYRFLEHVFIGLGIGYGVAISWVEVMGPKWFDRIFQQGEWMWLFLTPLAIMAYFVFSKKHGWISRIPLGMFIGLGAGNVFQSFWQTTSPQIRDTFKPLWPNIYSLQDPTPAINRLSISGAINNVIFLITLTAVLSYFLFAFEQKNKVVKNYALLGRWLIMIGFGAIFGSTIMTRFALLVDRMYLILVEWLHLAKAV